MNEWVLITGASSGIGREIAIELSKEYSVVLGGRDEARLRETAAVCAGETKIWRQDLAENSAAEKLAAFLAESGIVISRFVHAAGVSKIAPVNVTDAAMIDATFRVNAFAAFEIVKTLASKRGNDAALKSAVFVSSAIADRAAKGHVVYGASKAALDGFMRGLAVELAPKARVNSVRPGFVKTPMTEPVLADAEVAKRLAARYPLGLGEPQSVASMVAFLLSDRASWITGQEFRVDGGFSADITG